MYIISSFTYADFESKDTIIIRHISIYATLVSKWVAFYKQYRPILDSDIIHLRRPDGQDWDGIIHVNPALKQKGFISVYNPLNVAIEKEIRIPLYYTGLTDKVTIKEQDRNVKVYLLERDYSVTIPVTIPAKGYNWYIIE